ncbi:ER membrane glycoprotein subunit of the GPI transamidase complex-like protein [Coemansia sp. RSA 2706]|nr:ER membrane glycoprotein subunit of the GPI transamidase complex-like protein [Coemansia sp. RSA 2706]KAJ2309574.1 ER membrane glycoprotein subunit of the GPI transamidase complex-like protein [Coemansia sp. RSA 2705]KAJ2316973.1 ER membrane glycoprotein subunit of the GPI transamidase complex-like protein [Coemansia sp. RSA 2704]KAJ2321447.1 ER membrane glycoprotein subunit of the GPI transamidase complex-like protein [Coemansia sp. RSA 2702]KAJ2717370.1 ER membrane glycoprotein subunit of 
MSVAAVERAPQSRCRRRAVVKYAALSRLASLALALASRAIVGDYDASAQVVLAGTASLPAQAARALAQVVLRWDSFYFVHIAGSGYTYEQEHAFFPLLPAMMRLLASTALAPVALVAGEQVALAVAGAVVSNVCFVLAATTLYALGCRTLHNERLAYTAALLFVWAPSNMFMSSAQTESLFAWLAFTALLCIARRRYFAASLWLCASGLCRSNGVVYSGFLVWDLVVRREAWDRNQRRIGPMALQALRAAVLVAISALGFVAFQVYGYRQGCLQALHPAHGPRPYCRGLPATMYGFVQAEYWNVGFLRYYTLQQVPNFLLAAPMVALSVAGVYTYAAHDPVRLATLGWRRQRCAAPQAGRRPLAAAFLGDGLLPHITVWAALLAVAMTTMHVQVVTRFFSSVPAVFWYAAHAAAHGRRAAWAVAGYFAAFGLAGVVLFSSFFPPA